MSYADGKEIYHFETRESVNLQVSRWRGFYFSCLKPGAGGVTCGLCGAGIYINGGGLNGKNGSANIKSETHVST